MQRNYPPSRYGTLQPYELARLLLAEGQTARATAARALVRIIERSPDWRAQAFLLSRRHGTSWRGKTVAIRGANFERAIEDAAGGDWASAAFLLSRTFPKRWAA